MSAEELLTEFQKGQFCSAIALGSDRSTACAFVGATVAQLRATMRHQPDFEQEVLRSEAQTEIRHLGNVNKAAADEKNWRTSAWWLERRAPERFGRRAPQALTAQQVGELVDHFAEALYGEIPDAALRERLIQLLVAAAAAVSNVPDVSDPDADVDGATTTGETIAPQGVPS
jgi:hypothetical protein